MLDHKQIINCKSFTKTIQLVLIGSLLFSATAWSASPADKLPGTPPRCPTVECGKTPSIDPQFQDLNQELKQLPIAIEAPWYLLNNSVRTFEYQNKKYNRMYINMKQNRKYAERKNLIYENKAVYELPKNKRYNFVLLDSGEFVYGEVANQWEFGVKHLSLANGRKVKASGEMKVDQNGNINFNLMSGSFSERINSKVTSFFESRQSKKKKMQDYQNRVAAVVQRLFLYQLQKGPKTTPNKVEYKTEVFAKPPTTKEQAMDICSDKTFQKSNPNFCGQFCKEPTKMPSGLQFDKENLRFCMHGGR